MSKTWTWGELKGFIQRKHGIEIDTSYDEEELIEMANRAIDKVEGKIITLNQDYFLDYEEIVVTANQSEYPLPVDIYANKIRRVQLVDGSIERNLFRIRNLEDTNRKSGLMYLIVNRPNDKKIKLFPSPSKNLQLNVWFTRNANRLELNGGDTQTIDIPEFITAVKDYMSYLIEFKDKSPTVQLAKADYMETEKDMLSALAQGVDDEDTEIKPDVTFYLDSTGGY